MFGHGWYYLRQIGPINAVDILGLLLLGVVCKLSHKQSHTKLLATLWQSTPAREHPRNSVSHNTRNIFLFQRIAETFQQFPESTFSRLYESTHFIHKML